MKRNLVSVMLVTAMIGTVGCTEQKKEVLRM